VELPSLASQIEASLLPSLLTSPSFPLLIEKALPWPSLQMLWVADHAVAKVHSLLSTQCRYLVVEGDAWYAWPKLRLLCLWQGVLAMPGM